MWFGGLGLFPVAPLLATYRFDISGDGGVRLCFGWPSVNGCRSDGLVMTVAENTCALWLDDLYDSAYPWTSCYLGRSLLSLGRSCCILHHPLHTSPPLPWSTQLLVVLCWADFESWSVHVQTLYDCKRS